MGSSQDTYWSLAKGLGVRGDFIRMRERDGIRQITVKGEDRGTHLNRIEIDVDSTSPVSTITALLTAAHGEPTGILGKTYHVYWLAGGTKEDEEHTTVCCYELSFPGQVGELGNPLKYSHIIVEVETTSQKRMLALEERVLAAFRRSGKDISRAPGSLFTMFLKDK